MVEWNKKVVPSLPLLPYESSVSVKENPDRKKKKTLNLTVVFKHFEDLKGGNILDILKEKLVMSCLLGSFYLKIV